MSQSGSKAELGFKGIQSVRSELWAAEEKEIFNRLSIILAAIQLCLNRVSLFPGMELCCSSSVKSYLVIWNQNLSHSKGLWLKQWFLMPWLEELKIRLKFWDSKGFSGDFCLFAFTLFFLMKNKQRYKSIQFYFSLNILNFLYRNGTQILTSQVSTKLTPSLRVFVLFLI